jgi:phosphoribosylformylglycinamidine synthase
VIRPLVGSFRDGHADGTVLAEPSEAHGLAIGIGVNPWQGLVDPERMGLSVVDEAIRNVVACGADPDRVVLMDNFSWGDPRRPETLGQLVASVDGICAAAEAFGAPFISGKDSLNNEYAGPDGTRSAVPPTLVITAVAHVPDADRTVTPDLKVPGNHLLALGTATATFGGSHVARVLGVTDAGPVPDWDETAPARFRRLHRAILDGLVVACHDISEGGLAVAVAEMAIGGDLGVAMSTWPTIATDDASLGTFLYAETPGRFVIEVAPEEVEAIRDRFGHDVTEVGVVTADQRLVLPDGNAIEMATLRDAWTRVP